MNTLTTALHERAVLAIDGYDIDILNWDDDNVNSFDTKVLQAAQEVVADCSKEERKMLRMSSRCGSLVHADVAERLYELKATTDDIGLVAKLIIEMHCVVAAA